MEIVIRQVELLNQQLNCSTSYDGLCMTSTRRTTRAGRRAMTIESVLVQEPPIAARANFLVRAKVGMGDVLEQTSLLQRRRASGPRAPYEVFGTKKVLVILADVTVHNLSAVAAQLHATTPMSEFARAE